MARRRAMLRAVLGGMAAFALAVGGATAAVAGETVGSISGTVTSQVDGSPLAGIDVHAQSDDGLGAADAVTDANGGYTLEGLIDGDYVVRFSTADGGFLTEFWNDTREEWRAERVSIGEGAAVTGIDAALAPAPTGAISGIVTRDDDGSPLAGVSIAASGADGSWASTSTDETGAYTLSALAADSYVVSFFAEGSDLKREWWKDAFEYSQATGIIVEDAAVTGIDASLSAGGAVEGVVTREDDGSPIEGVFISALDASNEIVGETQTDAAGEYHLGGLPAGSYRLRFGSPDAELVSEYWKDAYGWSGATLIDVTEQQTLTGIDAALTALAYISGTVTTGADGEPAPSAVLVYDVDNRYDEPITEVNSDGTYRIPVVPGTYRVLFHAYEKGVAEEYWEDAATWDTATLLSVSAGEEADGIDAALDKVASITGTVSLDSDQAKKVVVEAWSDGLMVNSTRADARTGAYSLPVPKGTYILKATAAFTDGTTSAKPQFFDGVASAAEATPVSPAAGETVEGIDFTLVENTEPEPQPALTLSAKSITAGKDVTVSGSGFEPGAKIAFELRSDPIALGTLTADEGGVLTGSFRIPADVPAGAHTLVALSGSTVIASAALTVTAAAGAGDADSGGVTAPGDGLASTGAEAPIGIVAIGVVMAVLGGLLVRRRRIENRTLES